MRACNADDCKQGSDSTARTGIIAIFQSMQHARTCPRSITCKHPKFWNEARVLISTAEMDEPTRWPWENIRQFSSSWCQTFSLIDLIQSEITPQSFYTSYIRRMKQQGWESEKPRSLNIPVYCRKSVSCSLYRKRIIDQAKGYCFPWPAQFWAVLRNFFADIAILL